MQININDIYNTVTQLRIDVAVLSNEVKLIMAIIGLVGTIVLTDFIWRLITRTRKNHLPVVQ